ncbi:hypothetical protein LINPERHAP2_LOCUS24540, partial [Linum perenne]
DRQWTALLPTTWSVGDTSRFNAELDPTPEEVLSWRQVLLEHHHLSTTTGLRTTQAGIRGGSVSLSGCLLITTARGQVGETRPELSRASTATSQPPVEKAKSKRKMTEAEGGPASSKKRKGSEAEGGLSSPKKKKARASKPKKNTGESSSRHLPSPQLVVEVEDEESEPPLHRSRHQSPKADDDLSIRELINQYTQGDMDPITYDDSYLPSEPIPSPSNLASNEAEPAAELDPRPTEPARDYS